MSRSLFVRVCLGLTVAVLAICAVYLGLRSSKHDSIRLVDTRQGVDRMLAARVGLPLPAPSPSGLRREPIPEQDASLLWAIDPQFTIFDPVCYYRNLGGRSHTIEWPEHPQGRFVSRTSLDGYREDFDELPTAVDRRILVTGDSQADGMCTNAESFANLWELRLRQADPLRTVEVLNAAAGGYSLYHYLAVLERAQSWKPQQFVVAVYGGNDFLDVVRPWHYFQRTVPPARSLEYWQRMRAATQENPVLVGNCFNQLLYFDQYPDQAELALQAAEAVAHEIEEQCQARSIELCWVFIPVAFAPQQPLSDSVRKTIEALGFPEQCLERYEQLAERFLAGRKLGGGKLIDMRERYSAPRSAHYWSDGHINLEGHRRIAQELERELSSSLR